MTDDVERESMDYDVVVVGAGPAGLAAAIRLKQLAASEGRDVSVAVLEKGSEVGAHILSGAVIDPIALDELIPDWKARGAPLETPVAKDRFLALGPQGDIAIPMFPMPRFMHNHGAYIASLGNLCRWLAGEAEALGVEIYPGMAASDLVLGEAGEVAGVVAGVFGVGKDGERTADYQPGLELRARYTFIAEGARGSLAKQIIADYDLAKGRSPQKFGIGIKEVWQVPPERFEAGLVQHTVGWPLDIRTGGGSFMYHFGDRYVAIGLVVHLNYKNPWLSPFDEFQRLKHHPAIRRYLEGGRRIAYGARAITEGGLQSVPELAFPGGALIGCSAGFVNLPRIKGSHNAMKTGMMAAEAAFAAIGEDRRGDRLTAYQTAYDGSWVKRELHLVRNAKPLWTRFGTWLGGAVVMADLHLTSLTRGFSLFGTLKHDKTDAESTGLAKDFAPIVYPKPDGVLSFDKLSSVFLSSTNHAEDQPAHLKLRDPATPIAVNLP
ncbi:MAG: 4Fe-4S dicluster domain-containing protein, partial [Caulobacteraceae bacterium]|nr:4Fe-4S dicluster domain-containing protein [Caulobacteraceae bacterium]